MPTARLLSNGDFYTSGGAIDEIIIPRSKYAVQFNGSSQYLSIPNNSAFAFGTGAFTIEFWINAPSNNDKFILGGRSAIGTMHITTGGYGGSTVGCLRYVGSSTITTGSTLITDSSWHHCAIVRDGSNNITLYIDGVSRGTGTDTTNYTATTGTWYIGTNDVAAGSNLITGYFSNVRILKGTALYTTNFLPPAAPLNAITNTVLLTCQSSTITDNSTNAFVITNNGSATTQSSVLPTHTANRYLTDATLQTSLFDEVSIINNKYGVSFNGSSQYLTIPSNAAFSFGTGDFTVEAWLYTGAPNGSYVNSLDKIVFGGFSASSPAFLCFLQNNTNQPAIWNGSNQYNSSIAVDTNTWTHVAWTRSSGTLKIFVNGQLGLTQASYTTSFATNNTWYIGRDDTASVKYFPGNISNLRVVKGTAVYTSNFTPIAPLNAITNTVLLTCQSATIVDNSTNAFNITNNGTATVIQPALTYTSKRILNDGSMIISGVYDEITKFAPPSVEYLVVGGGGGGGWDGAGGGGGGGFLTGSIAVVAATNYTVTIGGGGNYSNGGDSSFNTVTALGGGKGGDKYGTGSTGGSGGGGGHQYGGGGSGTSGQGKNGAGGGSSGGGGGGGAGGDGSGGGGPGGTGGTGLSSSISGTSTYYSGGGGGGSYNSSGGAGGAGGGGYGGASPYGNYQPSVGTINTGGGSGGVGWGGGSSTVAGGSGIVIIRYLDSFPNADRTTGSPTFTNTGGYKIYAFTSSGSITF